MTSKYSTGFSIDMASDIYNTQKTEEATEHKKVGVLDRGYKNCMSEYSGVGFGGAGMESSVFLQCLVREWKYYMEISWILCRY